MNETAPSPSESPRRPLILVVDDEDSILGIIRRFLQIEDYRVMTASSGAEALALIPAHPPDVIIADLMMPQMDGLSLCRHIRRRPETEDIPVLVLTAASTDLLASFESGADDFMAKPFDPDELVARVRSLLRRKSKDDVLRRALDGHLHPERVKSILATPELMKLSGRRQEITVVSADVRNYNAMVSDFEAEFVVRLTNHVLKIMCDAVVDQGGLIDRITGDGLVALFGAPIVQEDDAVRAAAACAAMVSGMDAFNQDANFLRGKTLQLGVGAGTGEAVVGNFGTRQRLAYTAVGHCMYRAEYLENAAKSGEVLVCERTAEKIRHAYFLDEDKPVHLQGTFRPMKVFRLGAAKTELI